MSVIYQPNSVFQPSRVTSTAPEWEQISNVAKDLAGKGIAVVKNIRSNEVQANKFETSASMMNAINSTYMKGLAYTNPNDRAKYVSQSMDNQKEGLFSKVMPENMEYAKYTYNHLYNSRMLDIGKDIAKRNSQVAQGHIQSTYNSYKNQTLNTIRSGNTKDGVVLLAQSNKLLDGLLQSGAPAKTIIAERIKLNKQAYINAAVGQYELAVKNGHEEEFKKNFNKLTNYGKGFEEVNKNLSPQDKDSAISEFNKIDKQHAVENGIVGQKRKEAEDQLVFSAERTGTYNQFKLSEVQQSRKGSDIADRVNNALKVHNVVSNATSGNLSDLKSKISSLDEAQRTTKDLTEHTVAKRSLDILKDKLNLATNDPVQYIENTPQYQIFLKKETANKDFDKYYARVMYERQLGLDPRPLSSSSRTNIVDKINSFAPIHAMEIYNGHIQGIPPKSRPYVRSQLLNAGKGEPKLNGELLLGGEVMGGGNPASSLISSALSKKSVNSFESIASGKIKISNLNAAISNNVPGDEYLQALQNSDVDRNHQAVSYVNILKKIALQSMYDGTYDKIGNAVKAAQKVMHYGKSFHHNFNNGNYYMAPSDISDHKIIGVVTKYKNRLFDDKRILIPDAIKEAFGSASGKAIGVIQASTYWANTNDADGQDGLKLMYTTANGVRVPLYQETIVNHKRVKKLVTMSFGEIRKTDMGYLESFKEAVL